MSATPDSTLANPEQLIADLQRQLVECKAERDEALEQQTATAEVLQVINSSPGNLAPVFDAILEKALRLCEATHGHIWRVEGQYGHAVALRGDAQFIESMRHESPTSLLSDRPLRRIARGEHVVRLPDATKEEIYRTNEAFREFIDASGIRTGLMVALRKDETLLGAIVVHRKEVRPFSDKQIALLQNFGAQAVIAMENARLISETREALEQQTATAEVLGVINSSPGDLAPVFEAMLEKALRLCEAPVGNLQSFDGEAFHLVAARGAPPAYVADLRRGTRPTPRMALDRIIRGEDLVHTEDVTADDVYLSGNPLRRAFAENTGARTALWVALRKDNTLLGAFVIYRQIVRPFTDKQIALLQNFAAQAVIAMENARLITETREALEQQTATAEVLGVINSSPGDLALVFDAILEKAHALCGAEHGDLMMYDGEQFRAVALHGVPEQLGELLRQPFKPPAGGGQELLLQGEPLIHIPDIAAREPTTPISRAAVDAGVRTVLLVPLRKDDALLGYITAHRREVRPFSDKQIALLQNFAAQAVVAMENARLLTETREALEQQTATAEVLQVINSSPGDLAPVFAAMLEKATSLCGAAFGVLWIVDDDQIRAAASHEVPVDYRDFLTNETSSSPGPKSGVAQTIREKSVLHFVDAASGEAYRSGDPFAVAAVELGGVRTLLNAPLIKEGNVLGILAIYRKEVRPFTDKQIALLRSFAAQAVVAMENARLLGELRQRTDEVAELNRGLEARVAEQVEELGRVGRLKRFLAPQLAELIVSQDDEKILESHRREIVVVFCDLRGYTAFTETAEPEEVLDFLREYHGALGPLVSEFEGTLDQFSGDGIMVFFNDPVPCPDPAERAVKMAIAMRETANRLIVTWRRRDRELGFGVGIAQGYATLGQIGFADRSGYTAIGTVCNLAARLCAEAQNGQILVAGRVAAAVEETTALEDLGPVVLKGLTQPVSVFNVLEERKA
jgi:GAF domain-containing protein